MSGDVSDTDLDARAILKNIVVVAADFISRPHVGCDLDAGYCLKLASPRQHHHLYLLRDGEFRSETNILALQLLVESRDLLIGAFQLDGAFFDELLEIFRMEADFFRHAVEGSTRFADLVMGR